MNEIRAMGAGGNAGKGDAGSIRVRHGGNPRNGGNDEQRQPSPALRQEAGPLSRSSNRSGDWAGFISGKLTQAAIPGQAAEDYGLYNAGGRRDRRRIGEATSPLRFRSLPLPPAVISPDSDEIDDDHPKTYPSQQRREVRKGHVNDPADENEKGDHA